MSTARRVVASPVVVKAPIRQAVEEKVESPALTWDDGTSTDGDKCCLSVQGSFASATAAVYDDATAEPYGVPELGYSEVFYNGGINKFPNLGPVQPCISLCPAGVDLNQLLAEKLKYFSLTQKSRDPALYTDRAIPEYRYFLLNITAIYYNSLEFLKFNSCATDCCSGVAKALEQAYLTFNKLGRNTVLFNADNYGLVPDATPGIGDEFPSGAPPQSPANLRASGISLIYNRYINSLDTIFKLAGCTKYCPPKSANLPAPFPNLGTFPVFNNTEALIYGGAQAAKLLALTAYPGNGCPNV